MNHKPARDKRKLHKKLLKLDKEDIYTWLVTQGYFPEAYVMPPCFSVSSHPSCSSLFYPCKEKKTKKGDIKYEYYPDIQQLCELHFPKSKLTDRIFSIIHPKIHSDIAFICSENWKEILRLCLGSESLVYSYSFPEIPGNQETDKTRSGRGIYAFTKKFETALISEAYQYKYLLRSDVKNCYPSIYTHSIAWACHGQEKIRNGNRQNYSLFGNKLDKLFQNANDGCTNGIPIGPAVSDIICELVLSAVDRDMSDKIATREALVTRFKDDYRFLCKSQDDCNYLVKILQASLKKFHLLLNESKTTIVDLPEGLFREWRYQYDLVTPNLKQQVTQKVFKTWYQSVLRIDKENPDTGIIDRFISDLHKDNEVLLPLNLGAINQSISLLLLLAERRIKSFPSILGLLELMILKSRQRRQVKEMIFRHLEIMLRNLLENEENNRYLIAWIVYFLKSHKIHVEREPSVSHPVIISLYEDKNYLFQDDSGEFELYRSIEATRKIGGLLHHLDPFRSER